jgi:LuxR family maltose regulon positive regulatory protein
LINDLNAQATPLVLVLDDYHVIETRAIHEAIALLIERLPRPAHLFMTTRADPPFSLARWRARGLMVEVRQDDLRFTPAEVASLMKQTAAISFSPSDIALLEARTEGWAAALQLAALATRGHANAASFVSAFTGGHRYLMDYLSDEVLDRQPALMQDFMLATSVLNRMCADLCIAVAGEHSSDALVFQSMLEQIERANLFIIRLDEERRWYRYHHLFAEVLRGRLRRQHPHRIAELHRRASAWFAAQGLTDEAIHHAFAGSDYLAAAELIEGYGETLFIRGATDLLSKLIASVPDEVRRLRPRLLIYEAFFLALSQRPDEAERNLIAAEHTKIYAQATGAARDALHAEGDVVRTMILLGKSQFHEAIRVGRRALQHLPQSANRMRGTALQRMGTASSWLGDIPASIRYYRHALKLAEALNNLPTVLRCRYNLAMLEYSPRHARLGRDRLRDVIAFAEAHNMGETGNAGFALQDLAEIEYELNNIDTALQLVQRAVHIARQEDAPNLEVLGHCTHAKCLLAQGRPTEALEAAQHAFDLILRFNMAVRYTALAHSAWLRACLHANQIETAMAWINANPLHPDDFISVRWVEFAAHARVKLAQQRHADAMRLISQVVDDARHKQLTRTLFPALLFQSVLNHEISDSVSANEALTEALRIGESDRLLRAFLDEGEPMHRAVRQWGKAAGAVAQPASLIEYADVLLAAFADKAPATPVRASEFFSEREVEVLRLIAAGQSNQEIAGTLFISVATVKKHLYNAYGKLGVKSRTQALARAREIGLL